jgi:hypothetical protein
MKMCGKWRYNSTILGLGLMLWPLYPQGKSPARKEAGWATQPLRKLWSRKKMPH